MRKHNTKFAQRWSRTRDSQGKLDRSNFPQMMAHSFVKSKQSQLLGNSLLLSLMHIIGVRVPGAFMRKTV